ncbi:hypothetical protein HZH68_003482 [Vespula germanica]|uniref:Uncharacterized protein n=1 Tax=Vespula germanica TaxID=30212 RepID=A0A834NP87_VESGE|nr:hypothetical protein HZH68_003482 [Vespula germanica]
MAFTTTSVLQYTITSISSSTGTTITTNTSRILIVIIKEAIVIKVVVVVVVVEVEIEVVVIVVVVAPGILDCTAQNGIKLRGKGEDEVDEEEGNGGMYSGHDGSLVARPL